MNDFLLGPNECLGITKSTSKLKIIGQSDEFEISGGEIIKILRLVSLGGCFIKLYSTENRNIKLSDATYSCDHNTIKILNEKLVSMLITIGDREKRLMICNNSDYERFLINLKLNDIVKVNKFLFKRDHHVVCTVKYIGPVPEIGPGIYVGCTLYDDTDSINENNKLAIKYFNCNEKNGFIRNCGCFFTRTLLLDQNIHNLMVIVKASRRNNLNKPKLINISTETNKVNATGTIGMESKHLTTGTTTGSLNNRTSTIHPSNNLITETQNLNRIATNTTQPQLKTNNTTTPIPSVSSNQIPQQSTFRASQMYPENRPSTSINSKNNAPEMKFSYSRTSPITLNTPTEVRSSLHWAPLSMNTTPTMRNPEVSPKKNRCNIM